MKRALLISYHFPPSRAAGARRWDLLTKEGNKKGWAFDVIRCGSQSDEQGEPSIRVSSVPHSDTWVARLRRARLRVRSWLRNSSRQELSTQRSAIHQQNNAVVHVHALPSLFSKDGLKRSINAAYFYINDYAWVRSVERSAAKLAALNHYDAIICTSPPHLSSLAAARISRRFHIPLVLDFRDPWSMMEILQVDFASHLFVNISKYFERLAIKQASLTVMNTEEALEALLERYQGIEAMVVRNGSESFNGGLVSTRGKFVMLFAGSIYLDRDPRPLIEGFFDFVRRGTFTTEDVELRFVGEVFSYGGISLPEYVEQLGISEFVSFHPPVDRSALARHMAEAIVLINLPQGASLCVPSKLYEYFEYPSWLLAIERKSTATYNLLSTTDAIICDPLDRSSIYLGIAELYNRYRTGVIPIPIADKKDFSMTTQANKFFDRLLSLSKTPDRT